MKQAGDIYRRCKLGLDRLDIDVAPSGQQRFGHEFARCPYRHPLSQVFGCKRQCDARTKMDWHGRPVRTFVRLPHHPCQGLQSFIAQRRPPERSNPFPRCIGLLHVPQPPPQLSLFSIAPQFALVNCIVDLSAPPAEQPDHVGIDPIDFPTRTIPCQAVTEIAYAPSKVDVKQRLPNRGLLNHCANLHRLPLARSVILRGVNDEIVRMQ